MTSLRRAANMLVDYLRSGQGFNDTDHFKPHTDQTSISVVVVQSSRAMVQSALSTVEGWTDDLDVRYIILLGISIGLNVLFMVVTACWLAKLTRKLNQLLEQDGDGESGRGGKMVKKKSAGGGSGSGYKVGPTEMVAPKAAAAKVLTLRDSRSRLGSTSEVDDTAAVEVEEQPERVAETVLDTLEEADREYDEGGSDRGDRRGASPAAASGEAGVGVQWSNPAFQRKPSRMVKDAI